MKLSVLLAAIVLSVSICAQDRDTILVDFGSTNSLSAAPWNNITLPRTGSIDQLFRTDGFASGYGLSVTDRWNGVNQSGSQNPVPEIGIPATASGDSFFGNDSLWSEVVEPTGGLTLTGLTDGKAYLVEVFASRLASDNRQTSYLVKGLDSVQVLLEVSSNTDMLGMATVLPDENGEISITTSSGPDNDNDRGFHYLGALRLSYEAEDSPIPASLAWIQPMPFDVTWYDDMPVVLRWEAFGVPAVELSYSVDEGSTFVGIDTVAVSTRIYAWTPPAVNTETNIILRLQGGGLEARTNFELNDEDFSCTTVVIGSSTAAGSGASVYDSSWVGRFIIDQEWQNFQVITNLARGGYDTYRLLPAAYQVPGGAPNPVDTARNVDAALALDPTTIIINLPSNDAAQGFPVEDQMRNFTVMRDTILARSPDTRVIIATPQPRNFDSTRVQIQLDLLDAIRSSDFDVVDFWSGLATPEGTLDPRYNSGDGVHLNNAGHRLLFDRILAVDADQNICGLLDDVQETAVSAYSLSVYPNPIADTVTINLPDSDPVQIAITTMDGKVLYRQSSIRDGQTISLSGLLVDVGQAIITVRTEQGSVASQVVTILR